MYSRRAQIRQYMLVQPPSTAMNAATMGTMIVPMTGFIADVDEDEDIDELEGLVEVEDAETS